jgi:hypothetical protein
MRSRVWMEAKPTNLKCFSGFLQSSQTKVGVIFTKSLQPLIVHFHSRFRCPIATRYYAKMCSWRSVVRIMSRVWISISDLMGGSCSRSWIYSYTETEIEFIHSEGQPDRPMTPFGPVFILDQIFVNRIMSNKNPRVKFHGIFDTSCLTCS